MSIDLRSYQNRALEQTRLNFHKRISFQILSAPTGAGKTEMAFAMIDAALNANTRTAFICDRLSLVNQTVERAVAAGLNPGIIQADNTRATGSPFHICSTQTLESRLDAFPDFQFAIIDECHTIRKKLLKELRLREIWTVGLTATPFAEQLPHYYKGLVNTVSTDQLIKEGWLVPLRCYAATPINTKDLTVDYKGEWKDSDLADRAQDIVGDIIGEWQSFTAAHFGRPVPTLCYVPTVAFGDLLAQQFRNAGHDFQQVSYAKAPHANKALIADFKAGEVTGLINCDILVKGFDYPGVQCIIDARPYRKSFTAHIQKLGRGMRPAPGKDYCLLLDHAGNWQRFAPQTDDFWANGWPQLTEAAAGRLKESLKTPAAPSRPECPQCHQVNRPGSPRCAACGFVFGAQERLLAEAAQSQYRMREMSRMGLNEMKSALTRHYPPYQLWDYLLGYAHAQRNTRPERDDDWALRYAKANFKDLTGKWPPGERHKPGTPPPELVLYLDAKRKVWQEKNPTAPIPGYKWWSKHPDYDDCDCGSYKRIDAEQCYNCWQNTEFAA